MGLDSFLYAKKHVSNYGFEKENEKSLYLELLKFVGLKDGDIQKHTPIGEIKLCVGYWRKANEIHNWFVKNVQDGADECQSSYVSREQIVKLVENCKEILKDNNLAVSLLPTTSGFFFGSTEYDEDYFNDLKETVEELEKILNNPFFDDWQFEYQASW